MRKQKKKKRESSVLMQTNVDGRSCYKEILELCGNFESSMTLPSSPVNKKGAAGEISC